MTLDPVTNIDTPASGAVVADRAIAGWLCRMLQANDSFFPTGSYAHSFGLEGLIQQDVVRDRATLREFILLSALPMLEHSDLPLVAHAWAAVAEKDWARIGELSVLASALKPARELREASEKIGRQRAELAALLHGGIAREYLSHATRERWPYAATISSAVEARALGAPAAAAMSAHLYSSVVALLAAAMKLLRLGQNAAQLLLTETLDLATELVARAELVAIEEIGWFNPWLDIAAAHHETADARMFIS